MKNYLITVLSILCAVNCFAASPTRVEGDLDVNGTLYLNATPFTAETLLKNKGTYVSQTGYAAGDIVQYNGSTYIAKSATSAAPTDGAYWTAFAAQGPAGPTGATNITNSGMICGTVYPPTTTAYLEEAQWSVVQGNTNLSQLLSQYSYPNGWYLGLNNNISVQFAPANPLETFGIAVFKLVKFKPDGYTDDTFPVAVIGGGSWKNTTINGKAAIQVDFSAVRYAQPYDMYFTAVGANINAGTVFSTPSPALAKTVSFTSGLVSGKTVAFTMGSGIVNVTLAANNTVTGTNQDNSAIPSGMTWSINASGQLVIAQAGTPVLTITIVGGSSDACRIVTYTAASYTNPSQVIGPVTMKIF